MQKNIIYNEDCLKGFIRIENQSIDCIVTDPPFGIDFMNLQKMYARNPDKVLKGYNEINKEDYGDFCKKLLKECYCVLKSDGTMFLFSGWTNLKDVLIACDEAGFITKNHLIWKYTFGVFTKKKFVTSHQHVLFLTKHETKYTFNKIKHYPEDVIEAKRDFNKDEAGFTTPTKSPSELINKFIRYGSVEGDLVLDPFMGSGTTALECRKLKRSFIGFEIVEDHWKLSQHNLKKDIPLTL